MISKLFQRLAITGLGLLAAAPALSAPALRSDVVVSSAIVTVGDLFTDAGINAEEALFRAPAPGTTGLVDIAAIRQAAAKVGIDNFDDLGFTEIRVGRAAAVVDEAMLAALISDDLVARGIVAAGIEAETEFSAAIEPINAEWTDAPAKLDSLRYLPGNGAFTARFTIAGRPAPLDVSGRIELTVDAPHLIAGLPAGRVLQASDVEMRRVPLKFAESNGYAPIEALVGKALQRQSRAGMMLRPADVADPLVIARNDQVTVFFRNGAMTLTVKGLALTAAAKGQTVQVINTASKRVLTGVAVANGTVEVSATSLAIAGL